MLKTNKNITITGQSTIDNAQVIFMSASISTDGNTSGSITTTIQNENAYTANKVECRKDISDFQNLVYAAQDELITTDSTGSTGATAG